ncbi:hypothetical protein H6P81_017216 [Aristolochia fimbriata]|uniref:Pentatricopeptide repeat-containing protein n=1 Tax=Aristolochia fimbriata TaxID=158543 RepID=A0AAV7E0J4_ARIFI|nr:hypothetical protein H6P81_017216 [Aristolochia fimbriata]
MFLLFHFWNSLWAVSAGSGRGDEPVYGGNLIWETRDSPEDNLGVRNAPLRRKPSLSSSVVRTLHSLDWEIVRNIGFSNAVEMFGLSPSLEAYVIFVDIFSSAGLRGKVHCLIREIVSYHKSTSSDILPLCAAFSTVYRSNMASSALIMVLTECSLLENALDVFLKAKELGLDASISSCHFLLKSLAKRNEKELVKSLISLMERSGPPPNLHTYSILLKLCGKEDVIFTEFSLLEKALDAFWKAKKAGLLLDVFSCNSLLKCLAERNEKEFVKSVFFEMRNTGPTPNVYSYTILLNVYCKEDILIATGTLEEMETKGLEPTIVTYGTYINGLCQAGHIDLALKFIQELKKKNVILNNYCYNAIIHGFCCKGRLDDAKKVLDEMRRSGIPPDVHSYSILVDGFCKAGDVSNGCAVFDEMVNNGVRPNLVSYSALLDAYCRSGELEAAFGLFCRLGSCGFKYDKVAYSILIHGFSRYGYFDSAWKLLQEMKEKNVAPDIFIYTSLLCGYCRNGMLKEAIKLFKDLPEKGLLPNVFTCTVIVDGLCREGLTEDAWKLTEEMHSNGTINQFTYSTIINRLCREGNVDLAHSIFNLMIVRGLEPDVVVYSALINGFAKKSKSNEAFKLYLQMLKHDIRPNIVTHTNLVTALCEDNLVLEAESRFEELIQEGLAPDLILYTSLISGFCKIRNMKRAWELCVEMERKSLVPDVVTYSCLIYGYCLSHEMDKAVYLFHEMQKKKIDPNVVTYTSLINGFLKDGELGEAEKYSKKLAEDGILPDTIANIIWVTVYSYLLSDYDPVVILVCLPADFAVFSEQEQNHMEEDKKYLGVKLPLQVFKVSVGTMLMLQVFIVV